MNLLDPIAALKDPELLGAMEAFGDLTTWGPWLACVRAIYGLPMDEADLALFARHTGRTAPRPGGYPEAVVIVGCQSGKSQVAAALGAYEAARVLAGEARGLYVPLIAQDMRGAKRALFGYVREAFGVPMLRREVTRETEEALELAGGRVTVAVYPCRPASLRGIRAAALIVDELAFFIATDGRPTDTEMLRAARTRLATTGGKLLILSSPYGQSGALWDLYRKHYGREESQTLVWQASASAMNPTLPADYLDRMAEDDPEAYRSEVLGEFRAGLSTLFDPGALDACVSRGVREIAPAGGVTYAAFVDPSGGRADAFTVAVGHATPPGVVIDAVWARPAPFNPAEVVGEAAAFLKTYGVHQVTGDHYAGAWPGDAFRDHGINYETASTPKGDLYLEMLPAVNAGAVELLDLDDVMRELRGLERRRGSAGRDRVDHRPGAHDDRANVVAGVVSLLRRPVVHAAEMIDPGQQLWATYGRRR